MEDFLLLLLWTVKSICLTVFLLYFAFAVSTWMHLVHRPVMFHNGFYQPILTKSAWCTCPQSITVFYPDFDSPPSATIYRYYATNQNPKMMYPPIQESKFPKIKSKKENNYVSRHKHEINTDVSSYPLLPFHNQIPGENEDAKISFLSNPERTNRDLYCLYNRKWVTKRQFQVPPNKPIAVTLQPKPKEERMRSMLDISKISSRHNVSYL